MRPDWSQIINDFVLFIFEAPGFLKKKSLTFCLYTFHAVEEPEVHINTSMDVFLSKYSRIISFKAQSSDAEVTNDSWKMVECFVFLQDDNDLCHDDERTPPHTIITRTHRCAYT